MGRGGRNRWFETSLEGCIFIFFPFPRTDLQYSGASNALSLKFRDGAPLAFSECVKFRSKQPILQEINPDCILEGLMLKLKLLYFGHLMRRTDSLEKHLMLGKIEGRRRRR